MVIFVYNTLTGTMMQHIAQLVCDS